MIIYCQNGHQSASWKDNLKRREIITNESRCIQLYFECGICRSKQHIIFLNDKTEELQKEIDTCMSRNELGTMQDLKFEKAQIIEVLKKEFNQFINDFKE